MRLTAISLNEDLDMDFDFLDEEDISSKAKSKEVSKRETSETQSEEASLNELRHLEEELKETNPVFEDKEYQVSTSEDFKKSNSTLVEEVPTSTSVENVEKDISSNILVDRVSSLVSKIRKEVETPLNSIKVVEISDRFYLYTDNPEFLHPDCVNKILHSFYISNATKRSTWNPVLSFSILNAEHKVSNALSKILEIRNLKESLMEITGYLS